MEIKSPVMPTTNSATQITTSPDEISTTDFRLTIAASLEQKRGTERRSSVRKPLKIMHPATTDREGMQTSGNKDEAHEDNDGDDHEEASGDSCHPNTHSEAAGTLIS